MTELSKIEKALGNKTGYYLDHKGVVSKDMLHLPGPDSVDRILYLVIAHHVC